MFTEIELPYNDSRITARVPTRNLAYVLSARDEPGLPDERAAITAALRQPIASAPLRDRVKKSDKVVVLVTDYTRPCPDDRLLPPILAELETVVPRDNITIIVALGLHPPMDREALIKKYGKSIVEDYRVINHDVSDTINIGTTTRGTPVDINKKVIDADFRLSTGFIEPHFFAGFSGGRKSIAPGVFSVRSAYYNHGYKMLEHSGVRAGNLKGNPIHEDMVEQAKMAKLNFIVNVLLNKKREITHVVAGDPFQAHEAGCALEMAVVGVKTPRRVDIAITTNSGAPLDLDLYQTCKGIDTAAQITRPGGIIICASSCCCGVGPADFLKVHAAVKTPEEVLAKIRHEEPIGVQWENQVLARMQLKHEIYLLSDMDVKTVRDMMMTPIRSIEEGLEKAFAVLGKDASVGVIPQGPLVIPVLADWPRR